MTPSAIRTAIDAWIAAGKILPPSSAAKPQKIILSARQKNAVAEAADRAGCDVDVMIGRILDEGSSRPTGSRSTDGFSVLMNKLGFESYEEQNELLQRVRIITDRGAIGFAEAPTGTGKTLVGAYAAMTATDRVVIAEPTVALVHQVAGVLRLVSKHIPGRSFTPILGMQEFVSVTALREILPTLPSAEKSALSEWIENGGPGPDENYPSWTFAGLETKLKAVGGSASLSQSYSLAAHPCPVSRESYKEQFDTDADILLVTHAMLARDSAKRRIASRRAASDAGIQPGRAEQNAEQTFLSAQYAQHFERLAFEIAGDGLLPDWDRLIIDEAQQLDTNFASALTSAVSIRGLGNALTRLKAQGAKGIAKKHIDLIKTAADDLTAMGKRMTEPSIMLGDLSPEHRANSILSTLSNAIPKLTGISEPMEADAGIIRRAANALQLYEKRYQTIASRIVWSPVQAFPSFEIGGSTMLFELSYLWARSKSAVLLSGTLFLKKDAGYSDSYMALKLSVPDERRIPLTPVTAPWANNAVELHVPADNSAADLLPPAQNDNEDAWLETVSDLIETAAGDDQRGTLVLCPSRKLVGDLTVRLAKRIDKSRLSSSNFSRLSEQIGEFITSARAGHQPLWIATGAAWTGLDIPDDALGTLIIPRLPFRAQPSLFNEIRRSNHAASFISEQADMLILLRQGIGRLVRSRTAKNKHLWILDGRIAGGHRAGTGARALMSVYEKQRTFELNRKKVA